MKGSVPFGSYGLIQRLGSGGMAEVFKAIAPDHRVVAIKKVLPHLFDAPEARQRLLEEAWLAARLHHPNIVELLEVGEIDGVPFLAMEYVHGRDLRSLLERMGDHSRPPGLAAFVVREICRALTCVHGARDDRGSPLKAIHRDVTPRNILLGFDGSVKLTDFGIAKVLRESRLQTRTGVRPGTLAYMAPEQAEGGTFDHRVDLFAAGTILSEAMLYPPAELQAICRRALASDPKDRYSSALEMTEALDAVVQQSGWDAARLSETMGELFPEERDRPSQPQTRPAEETVTTAKMPGKSRPYWMVSGCALVLFCGWWISRRPTGSPRGSNAALVHKISRGPVTSDTLTPPPTVSTTSTNDLGTPVTLADAKATPSAPLRHRDRSSPQRRKPAPLKKGAASDFLPNPFVR